MNNRGFTLLEVLITIAILGSLFLLSAYGLRALQKSFASQTVDRELTNILTTAARNARLGLQGDAWGVYIPYDLTTRTTSSVTLFHGDSYATRISADDVLLPINTDAIFTSVDFSGAAASTGNDHEIVFDSLSGATQEYGSIVLDWYAESRTISISKDGIITREAL